MVQRARMASIQATPPCSAATERRVANADSAQPITFPRRKDPEIGGGFPGDQQKARQPEGDPRMR
jgi:hypothetical protein